MHLKRTQVNRKIPIPRKGTKYVARARSHVNNSVPVVVAIRDMIKIAKTLKEVKHMINEGKIKINGKKVKDAKESVRLFNVLSAEKDYELTVLPTKRFEFKEKKGDSRLCKVSNKKSLSKNKVQLNLHDGTNVLVNEKEKIQVGDSLELGFDGKIKKIIQIEKGKNIFVISGGSLGLHGKITHLDKKKAKIKFEEVEKEVELDTSHIIAT